MLDIEESTQKNACKEKNVNNINEILRKKSQEYEYTTCVLVSNLLD